MTQKKSMNTTNIPKSAFFIVIAFPPAATLSDTVSLLQVAIARNQGSGNFGVDFTFGYAVLIADF